ncbi:HNH endonuclease [Cognataquiflexum rubidum]|uniref:HNH endonuclease n=1 Tax=Cognataquiflexum rubidum TaxID=2922273 RepID=UPI001F1301DB|nr:HNH endonuclease [Cognataquiflexum rubidum]MCH6235789.1 HNH endonuclease [Cognataquiflexum rubidum]
MKAGINSEIKEESFEELKINLSKSKELNVDDWCKILLDKELTKETELSIFQELYTFQEHKAYASQIARYLGTTLRPLNLDIKKYAQKIAIKYNIAFTELNENQYKFWFLFFNVWEEGTKNIWQLKSELKIALEQTNLTGISYGGELPPDIETEFFEGLKKIVLVNSYERNLMARKTCIKHWKAICSVCEFDFEKQYGEIGKGFIHVHHLIPISQIGETYKVDPINDLIPICPNCHSILHKKEPPFSIEDMKKMIRKKSS